MQKLMAQKDQDVDNLVVQKDQDMTDNFMGSISFSDEDIDVCVPSISF